MLFYTILKKVLYIVRMFIVVNSVMLQMICDSIYKHFVQHIFLDILITQSLFNTYT